MGRPLTIAVIGSGISGLSAAWLLSRRHAVTLFEREARLGGHSNTVDVKTPDGTISVDTGFIVYNEGSYPNLVAMFAHLGVPTRATSMSFGVSFDGGAYEYSGSGLAGLFGQPSNLVNLSHLRMIADIARFFRQARALLSRAAQPGPSLADFLGQNNYSAPFIARHIVPMAAAIWSTPSADVLAFPALAFARFLDNHGLLQAQSRPDWRTVQGGSRVYVQRLREAFQGQIELATPALKIRRDALGVTVETSRGEQRFDACVLATHADETLALLSDPSGEEQRLLGAIDYTPNVAVLHTDPTFMPRRRRLWSSWNYMAQTGGALSVSYWMNNLQHLACKQDIFVTLNPATPLKAGTELGRFAYTHPRFDQAAMDAGRRLWDLQGQRNTWFCGSYFGYGFHEDGLQSGLAVAEDLGGVRRPWSVANESGRLSRSPKREPVLASLEPA